MAAHSKVKAVPLLVTELLTIDAVSAVRITALCGTYTIGLGMSSLCKFFIVVTTKRFFEPSFGEYFATLESNDDETN